MIRLLKRGVKVFNCKLDRDELCLNKRIEFIINDNKYGKEFQPIYVVCKLGEDRYKDVSNTHVSYIDKSRLEWYIENELVINYVDGELVEMLDLTGYNDFEEDIQRRIKGFTSKMMLMKGDKVNMEVSIEGENVMLTKYTTSRDKIYIPPFIKSIEANCFRKAVYDKSEIELGSGVKWLGNFSLYGLRLREIDYRNIEHAYCQTSCRWAVVLNDSDCFIVDAI